VLVAEHQDSVVGWARVIAYSEREVYAGVGEVSVYVSRAARGQGIGTALLRVLQDTARTQGYWKLLGKLFTENVASAAMIRRAGWREVGMHERHAQLDGRWRDVLLVERSL
jgi:L-amino acid N-acyltransferase YncA